MKFPAREFKKFIPGLVAAVVVILIVGALLFISNYGSSSPDAVITINSQYVRTNTPVMVDGTNSTDPDGPDSDLEYQWEIGDTFRTSEPSFQFSFTEPGNYTITLRVTDPSGRSDTEEVTVDVTR